MVAGVEYVVEDESLSEYWLMVVEAIVQELSGRTQDPSS
jgi:hypothetical protein